MTALLLAAVALTILPPSEFRAIGTFKAATVTYASGEADTPGNHEYDIVLVPIDEGMTAEVDGALATWTPGVPILISRGAPHRISNATGHTIQFVEVRTVGDNLAGNDATLAASAATIVRSTVGKYVRATVWRMERGGRVEWPADIESLLVVRRPVDVYDRLGVKKSVVQTEFMGQTRWENSTGEALELVRISRMADR